MLALVLLLLLGVGSAERRDAYLARLAEHAHTGPDWSDFLALCGNLAFERDTVHLMPLRALGVAQQYALLTQIRRLGWRASLELARVTRAEQFIGVMTIGRHCLCRVLATDAPDDNASYYRRQRNVSDYLAGLEGPFGREIILAGATRVTREEGRHNGWWHAREEACSCANEEFAVLTLLRLETTE